MLERLTDFVVWGFIMNKLYSSKLVFILVFFPPLFVGIDLFFSYSF